MINGYDSKDCIVNERNVSCVSVKVCPLTPAGQPDRDKHVHATRPRLQVNKLPAEITGHLQSNF